MTDNFYYDTEIKCEGIKNYFSDKNLEDLDIIEYHGFKTIFLDRSIWEKEKFLIDLDQKYKIKGLGILRLDPKTFYKWHKDGVRGVAINCLLQDHHSHCLFSKDDPYLSDRKFEFFELKYNPYCFYILNVQQWHCVINLEKVRFMLSLEFEDNLTKLKYEDIVDWFNNYKNKNVKCHP